MRVLIDCFCCEDLFLTGIYCVPYPIEERKRKRGGEGGERKEEKKALTYIALMLPSTPR